MDELVTIIVPIYNTSAHLERCITSLTLQAYITIQIILVDDGSTDGSGDICDAFAKQDTRIEVIHQVNGGIAAARNAGLTRVRGAWIAFVDSDDYVSPYYIEDMLFANVRDDCDIAICRYVKVQKNNDECAAFQRTGYTQYRSGREACLQRYSDSLDIYNHCWGKLFKSRLWTELRFPEGKVCEDLFVSHALLYRAGRIAIMDAVLYAYVQTDNSYMRSAFMPRRLEALDAWQEGVRFYKLMGDFDLAHIVSRVYCGRVFDARYICKKEIPHEHEIRRLLWIRAKEAYIEAKPIRGYADCSARKALAYRLMFFIGRWCLPLYIIIFIRRSTWRKFI